MKIKSLIFHLKTVKHRFSYFSYCELKLYSILLKIVKLKQMGQESFDVVELLLSNNKRPRVVVPDFWHDGKYCWYPKSSQQQTVKKRETPNHHWAQFPCYVISSFGKKFDCEYNRFPHLYKSICLIIVQGHLMKHKQMCH